MTPVNIRLKWKPVCRTTIGRKPNEIPALKMRLLCFGSPAITLIYRLFPERQARRERSTKQIIHRQVINLRRVLAPVFRINFTPVIRRSASAAVSAQQSSAGQANALNQLHVIQNWIGDGADNRRLSPQDVVFQNGNWNISAFSSLLSQVNTVVTSRMTNGFTEQPMGYLYRDPVYLQRLLPGTNKRPSVPGLPAREGLSFAGKKAVADISIQNGLTLTGAVRPLLSAGNMPELLKTRSVFNVRNTIQHYSAVSRSSRGTILPADARTVKSAGLTASPVVKQNARRENPVEARPVHRQTAGAAKTVSSGQQLSSYKRVEIESWQYRKNIIATPAAVDNTPVPATPSVEDFRKDSSLTKATSPVDNSSTGGLALLSDKLAERLSDMVSRKIARQMSIDRYRRGGS